MHLHEILLNHNHWATQTLLDACRPLAHAQFHQKFDIGPGSLHATLLHIAGAMLRWSDRISGRTLRESPETRAAPHTIDEIAAYLDESTESLRDIIGSIIRENRLDELMQVTFRTNPKPIIFSRGTAIIHVMTHGAHHRAQALNMLRRLGVANLPDLDTIEWELSTRHS